MRTELAKNVYLWNAMRNAASVASDEPDSVPNLGEEYLESSAVTPSPDFPDETSTPEEQELFSVFSDYLLSEVFFYFEECLHSRCVGATISLEECRTDPTPKGHKVVQRDNNDLIISVASTLEMLSYTPMSYTFASPQQRHRFYSHLARRLVSTLQKLGYNVIARDTWRRGIALMDPTILEGQVAMCRVSMIVRWASDEYANQIEHLRYASQLQALEQGIDVIDILCGEDLPPAPKLK